MALNPIQKTAGFGGFPINVSRFTIHGRSAFICRCIAFATRFCEAA